MKNKTHYLKIIVVLGFCCWSFVAQAQSLDLLIEEAMQNNPEIQKFELQYRIAKEKVNEVNTIPNTEFAVWYFISAPETRTGAQRARFSVKQL